MTCMMGAKKEHLAAHRGGTHFQKQSIFLLQCSVPSQSNAFGLDLRIHFFLRRVMFHGFLSPTTLLLVYHWLMVCEAPDAELLRRERRRRGFWRLGIKDCPFCVPSSSRPVSPPLLCQQWPSSNSSLRSPLPSWRRPLSPSVSLVPMASTPRPMRPAATCSPSETTFRRTCSTAASATTLPTKLCVCEFDCTIISQAFAHYLSRTFHDAVAISPAMQAKGKFGCVS